MKWAASVAQNRSTRKVSFKMTKPKKAFLFLHVQTSDKIWLRGLAKKMTAKAGRRTTQSQIAAKILNRLRGNGRLLREVLK